MMQSLTIPSWYEAQEVESGCKVMITRTVGGGFAIQFDQDETIICREVDLLTESEGGTVYSFDTAFTQVSNGDLAEEKRRADLFVSNLREPVTVSPTYV